MTEKEYVFEKSKYGILNAAIVSIMVLTVYMVNVYAILGFFGVKPHGEEINSVMTIIGNIVAFTAPMIPVGLFVYLVSRNETKYTKEYKTLKKNLLEDENIAKSYIAF